MLYPSRFNYVVRGENGEQLIFNTANGAFGVLDDAGMACLATTMGNPEGAGVADELERAGFLTSLTPEEELDYWRVVFEDQRTDLSQLMLVIAPTYACNYRCPYCYELGHNSIPGIMDKRTCDALCRFIERRYKEHAFESLAVQWYGGDPSLALGVVESLSEWMMSFCDERGIAYTALMLTNCNLIDEAAADMLARCRVSEVLITIDGFEETHNKRRVAANGSNSFERNVNAARLFVERGIAVRATMNVDRVNWPEYHDLREYLRTEIGVELMCGRLCDYGHFFGTRDFRKPTFDLFEHDEYCRLQHEEFVAGGFDASKIGALLSSCSRFCNGQRNSYYVIDSIGDVYACDGWIGVKDHVEFSIFNDEAHERLAMVSHDPFESAQCRACTLLPLCMGNCDWERRLTGMKCHPLLTTLSDYLRDYRSCFGDASGPFTRFA